jgi:hypothetical protein
MKGEGRGYEMTWGGDDQGTKWQGMKWAGDQMTGTKWPGDEMKGDESKSNQREQAIQPARQPAAYLVEEEANWIRVIELKSATGWAIIVFALS